MNTIKIVTASADGVAERWFKQYRKEIEAPPRRTTTRDPIDIYNQLCALGTNPSIDAVAEVIGNKSWTHIFCAGCTEYVTVAIELGNYDDTRQYCCDCINRAHTAFALYTAGPVIQRE